MFKKVLKGIFVGIVMLSFVGCTSFEAEYRDPNEVEILDDKWNETDARKTAESLISSVLSKPWLQNYKAKTGKRPIVFVDEVENRTDEHIDTVQLTSHIRRALVNSGRVRFINAKKRQRIMEEIKHQQSGAVSAATKKDLGRQLGADFMLGGSISSSVHTQGEKKSVTYTTDLSLTNLSTTEMEWTDGKSIKKSFKRSGASW